LGSTWSSLAEEWSRRIKGAESKLVFREITVSAASEDALLFVFADEGREVARTTFVPPTLEGHARSVASAFSGRRLGSGTAKSRSHLVDRPRKATDALRPEVKPPHFAPAALKCEMLDDCRVALGPLPAARLDVRVSTLHATGEASIPASHHTTRIRVGLRAR
jgi:hypothetical protein